MNTSLIPRSEPAVGPPRWRIETDSRTIPPIVFQRGEKSVPGKPITMRKINEILRLRHQSELSQREIANALRLSVGVVNKYLNVAAAADIRWPLPDLSEPELRHHIQSRDNIPNAAPPRSA